jgi:hypothetical protein
VQQNVAIGVSDETRMMLYHLTTDDDVITIAESVHVVSMADPER